MCRRLHGVAGVGSVSISVEAGADQALRGIARLVGLPVRFAEAADNIADRSTSRTKRAAGPVVVTTADNVLSRLARCARSPTGLRRRRRRRGRARPQGGHLAATPRRAPLLQVPPTAAFPMQPLRPVARGLKAAEAFRAAAVLKHPIRIARAFGFLKPDPDALRPDHTERGDAAARAQVRVSGARVILADGAHAATSTMSAPTGSPPVMENAPPAMSPNGRVLSPAQEVERMAEFTLPKNSKVRKGRAPSAPAAWRPDQGFKILPLRPRQRGRIPATILSRVDLDSCGRWSSSL